MSKVVQGYLVEGGEFKTNPNWNYESFDSFEDLDEELQERFKSQLRDGDSLEDDLGEIYQTLDGQLFVYEDLAKKHAKTVKTPELDEVLELIQKAKILCDANKTKPGLGTVLHLLNEILDDGGAALLDKWYDSTC